MGQPRRVITALLAAISALAWIGGGLAPVRAAEALGIVAIGAGDGFTCAVIEDGSVRCWGDNTRGQLGIGSTAMSTIPKTIPGISTATGIAVGRWNACALLGDGSVRCWGANDLGQLGDGTQIDRHIPVTVSGITTAVAVDAADASACAVLGDGTVRCWGSNNLGQLGDGTTTLRVMPVAVLGLSDATDVAVGGYHACAVRSTGTVACWGGNSDGQVRPDAPSEHEPLTEIAGVMSVQRVSLGWHDSCALHGGSVACWGGSHDDPSAPTDIAGMPAAVAGLDGGRSAGCAALVDGTAACWGWSGESAISQWADPGDDPVVVAGLDGSTAITLGNRHACAATSTIGGACWGLNTAGALGDRTTIPSATPRPISWDPDDTLPTTTVPRASIPEGKLGSSGIPGLIVWASGDGAGGTGVHEYDLEWSRDGGATWTAIGRRTDRYATMALATSGTTRIRVRGWDGAGNAGAWSIGPTLTPRVVQDGSSSITYTGTWTRRENSSYSGGAVRMTTQAGAKARFTFTGRAVAFVTRMGTGRGNVRIYVDGVSQGVVDLSVDSKGAYRLVAWERSWATSGTHTVTIVALGTAGRPRVDLDAFAVIR